MGPLDSEFPMTSRTPAVTPSLSLDGQMPIEAFGGGLVISRGDGRHIDRVCNHFDLIFVREGTLPIQEEQQAFLVESGQTLLLWPGRRHWGMADYPADLRFYWLHFTIAAAVPGKETAFNAQPLDVPQYTNVQRPEFLEVLFRRYLDDQETGRLRQPYASVLAWLMLCEIADQRPVSATERTAAAVAGRALIHIRSHLHLPLTTSQVATELGYNPDYLNRAFQQTYRHTLTQEIHRSRLGYARYLLLTSHKNVAEIATACGFTDTRYFSRLFKRYEGMTPMQFRRLHAQVYVNYE